MPEKSSKWLGTTTAYVVKTDFDVSFVNETCMAVVGAVI
jgi:hypothetical protein